MFHDLLSGVGEMVAAEPAVNGWTTPLLPPPGLYVILYKAFLSASQAWFVYTALGAYPWHCLRKLCWSFRSSPVNRGESGWNSGRKEHHRFSVALAISPGGF